MAEEDGFLSRWSKRKRAVAEEAKAIPVSAPALPEPVVEEAEPEFDISTLPSLEELSKFSANLRELESWVARLEGIRAQLDCGPGGAA